jgi:uncharacterized protein YecE (DUF72 family)
VDAARRRRRGRRRPRPGGGPAGRHEPLPGDRAAAPRAELKDRRATRPVRIGCSGWNYRDWRDGAFYPPRCPPRRWLSHYATRFDTVEVNATFYRLASPDAVLAWVEQTPPDFLFTVKASRYLTHMKRLTDLEPGIARFYEHLDPLVRSPKLGPVLWQLPESFRRDDDRLAGALAVLPPGRHAFEFRHPSWFSEPVYALLRSHGVALAFGDDPRRPWVPLVTTTDWTLLRFHRGHRGRRGNYSEAELRGWAARLAEVRADAEVLAYFNNDWEAFAPRNATRLRVLVEAASGPSRPAEGC